MNDFLHVIKLTLNLGFFISYLFSLSCLNLELFLLALKLSGKSQLLLLPLLELLCDPKLLSSLFFQGIFSLQELLFLLHSLFHCFSTSQELLFHVFDFLQQFLLLGFLLLISFLFLLELHHQFLSLFLINISSLENGFLLFFKLFINLEYLLFDGLFHLLHFIFVVNIYYLFNNVFASFVHGTLLGKTSTSKLLKLSS